MNHGKSSLTDMTPTAIIRKTLVGQLAIEETTQTARRIIENLRSLGYVITTRESINMATRREWALQARLNSIRATLDS